MAWELIYGMKEKNMKVNLCMAKNMEKERFYLNGELIYEGTWKFDKPSVFG